MCISCVIMYQKLKNVYCIRNLSLDLDQYVIEIIPYAKLARSIVLRRTDLKSVELIIFRYKEYE